MIDRRTTCTILHGSRLSVLLTCAIGLVAMLAASCARLPQLKTVEASAGKFRLTECSTVFPVDRWRLVHSIETAIAGHSTGVVVGITIVTPADREVEAIIMTLEGLVLFHARHWEDTTDILRAIAPFDSPLFAKGLIEDVRLLFLEPLAVKTLSGFSANGSFTCRYFRSDASAVDVLPSSEGGWILREYDRRAKLRRKVTAQPPGGCPAATDVRLPCHIDLEAYQQPAYTLKMSLIEAERVTKANQ